MLEDVTSSEETKSLEAGADSEEASEAELTSLESGGLELAEADDGASKVQALNPSNKQLVERKRDFLFIKTPIRK